MKFFKKENGSIDIKATLRNFWGEATYEYMAMYWWLKSLSFSSSPNTKWLNSQTIDGCTVFVSSKNVLKSTFKKRVDGSFSKMIDPGQFVVGGDDFSILPLPETITKFFDREGIEPVPVICKEFSSSIGFVKKNKKRDTLVAIVVKE